MTDRSKLLALADAVEKLQTPSWEVDAEIDAVIWGRETPRSEGGWNMLTGRWMQPNEPYCKKYTASLDEAMTLVPEGGWYWAVKNYPVAKCAASIGGIHYANAATPALALTAACLRARAQAEALS